MEEEDSGGLSKAQTGSVVMNSGVVWNTDQVRKKMSFIVRM